MITEEEYEDAQNQISMLYDDLRDIEKEIDDLKEIVKQYESTHYPEK